MNRRDFIQSAALLVAGCANAPQGWTLNKEQQQFIADQKGYRAKRKYSSLNSARRALVANAAECILPRTDTPGAIDAEVPQFIESMVVDWFNESEQRIFFQGLTTLETQATGDSIEALARVLDALETEAENAAWYNFGNISRVWDSDAPFICQFKELVVLGFFLSEVGAKQVLRENPMGSFNGDIPLSQTESSYGNVVTIRSMAGSGGI